MMFSSARRSFVELESEGRIALEYEGLRGRLRFGATLLTKLGIGQSSSGRGCGCSAVNGGGGQLGEMETMFGFKPMDWIVSGGRSGGGDGARFAKCMRNISISSSCSRSSSVVLLVKGVCWMGGLGLLVSVSIWGMVCSTGLIVDWFSSGFVWGVGGVIAVPSLGGSDVDMWSSPSGGGVVGGSGFKGAV